MGRLVINGDEIYELDEECLKEKRKKESAAGFSCARERNDWPNVRTEEQKKW